MRFGIIADVHANWEALTVALKLLEAEGVDQIISLGDTVGYNANPRECLNLLMEKKIPSIKGNHERYILGEKDQTMKEDTDQIIAWTKEQLSPEQYHFIAENMPNKMLHESGFLLVHGSPRNKDEYLLKLHSFVSNLKFMEEKYPDVRICFHGHTHLPSIIARGHILQDFTKDTTVELMPDRQYLINPGSVGQPRDQCPLTSCGIYDEEKLTFQFFRRPYDIESAQQKIMRLGLFSRFAERLALGK